MIRTWRAQQRLLNFFTAALLVIGIGLFTLRELLPQWQSPSSQSPLADSTKSTSNPNISPPAKKRSNASPSLPAPTQDEIERAAKVGLHRMRPPLPAPPPPVVPQVPKAITSNIPSFSGRLIGVIQDHQPQHSFAILQWPDNQIRLISQGKPIGEDPNSPTLVRIESNSIQLKLGETLQIVEMMTSP